MTEEEAIKKAVGSRMDWLDEAFLVALGAYVKAADEQGDAALAGDLCKMALHVSHAAYLLECVSLSVFWQFADSQSFSTGLPQSVCH